MNAQQTIAAVVDNNISGSNVKQYYFFDCDKTDCQVLFKEISEGGTVVPIEEPADLLVTEVSDSGVASAEESVIPEIITEVIEVEDSVVVEVTDQIETTDTVAPITTYSFQSVRINEIVSAAETGEKEWVELYNPTTESIDLQEWTIEEGSNTKTILTGQIEAKGYLVFETKNLNNSGDLVLLKDATGKVIDQVVYGDWDDGDKTDNWLASDKGESLSLYEGEYVVNPQITKGEINLYDRLEPVVETQTETIVQTEVEVNPQPVETVDPEVVEAPGAATTEISVSTIPYQYSDAIRISEYLPAPAANSEEWIELYNSGSIDVDLRGWSIDDAEGGSSPYIIPESLIIKSQSYLVLPQSTTKVQLNNSSDEVRLIDPDQKVIDAVSYAATHSDISWSKIDTNWVETELLTPELVNAAVVVDPLAISSVVEESETESEDQVFKGMEVIEAAALDLRTQVMVEAAVTVLPGTFSKNVIYVQDETGGIQVYFDAATWPQLALGQEVVIAGTISQSLGEKRILIKNATDVFVKDTTRAILPFKINTGMLSPALVGSLVELESTLFEKDGSTWFMTDAQGGVKVYLKKGTQISSTLFNVNDKLKITGVLVQNSGEFMIQPRNEQDIVNLSLIESGGAGASIEKQETIPPGSTQKNVLVGLGVGAGVLGTINVFLALKKYIPKRKIRGYWYRLKTSLQS